MTQHPGSVQLVHEVFIVIREDREFLLDVLMFTERLVISNLLDIVQAAKKWQSC